MNNGQLVKHYVKEVLRESGTFYNPYERDESSASKGPGFLEKIKSFFTGTSAVDEIVSDWIDDCSMQFDFDLPSDLMNDARSYARSKWKIAVKKARGNEGKAASLMRRALDSRYKLYFKELADGADNEKI